MFIPNGFQFYLPEVKWKSPRMASFDRIVNELLGVIAAHRDLAAKHGWPTTRSGVEDWVDVYNATVCARMGWNDYILTGAPPVTTPKASAPLQSLKSLAAAAAKAKELVSGAKTLMEWDESGEGAVDRDLATSRAATCVACPKNESGDWTQWFTTPAAELIRRRVAKVHNRGLSTIYDEQLKLCSACYCPLQLKVHVPIAWIKKPLTPAQIDRFKSAPNCWVIREMNA